MTRDFAVVGGGIVGLAVARRIAEGGASVLVVDRGHFESQATWAAAGMLAPQGEADSPDPFFSLLLRSREAYPQLVEALREETGIDTGYRTEGMIFAAFREEEEHELEQRYRWQTDAGLEVERLSAPEVLALEPALAPGTRGALFFAGDHQVDNRLLARALHASATRAGVEITRGSAVEIRVEGSAAKVVLDGGSVVAGAVVIAAGSWSGSIAGLPRPLPVEPVFGELISIETTGDLIRHVIASAGGYLVPRSGGRVIAGTTVRRIGFRDRATLVGVSRIAATAAEMAPVLGGCSLAEYWSGLRPGTPDGWPILGRDPDEPRILYAVGHYRNGILLGPLTGELIGDVALGRTPEIDLHPFRPDRFTG